MPNYPKGGYDMALMDKVFLPHLLNGSKNTHTPLLAYWLGYQPEVVPFTAPRVNTGNRGGPFVKKMNTFLDVMLGFSVTPIRSISLLGVGGVVPERYLWRGGHHQFDLGECSGAGLLDYCLPHHISC